MDKETTRVEVLSAHYYGRDRQPSERYDCANQHLPVVLGRGLVRIVEDQESLTSKDFIESEVAIPWAEYPVNEPQTPKRKRGRPFGSHGPYKKRSIVSETSVDR